jgi:hypothetical protein
MKTRILTLVLGLMTAIPGICQVSLARYKGDGYTFSYPSNWKREVNGRAVALLTPELANQISFKIFASGDKTKEAFFEHYRAYAANGGLGFSANFGSGTQPMAYGSWLGFTIDGQGISNGISVVVSATAIEANNQFYLLQLIAPIERSWEAHEYLAPLARSLTFDNLPKRSGSSGGAPGCNDCLSIWTNAMDRINAQTIRSMK